MYKLKIILPTLLLFILGNNVFSQSWHGYVGYDSLYINGTPSNAAWVDHFHIIGDSLLVTGGYIYADDTELNCVSVWHDYNWYPMGLTEPCDDVTCSIMYDDVLWVGGGTLWEPNDIEGSDGLAIWNGTQWAPAAAPGGVDIFALTIIRDTLFVGGALWGMGGTESKNVIAYYDGEWISVCDYMGSNWVTDIVEYNGEMLASGWHGIKKRTGATTWEEFPGAPSYYAYDMKIDTFNNFLYVGGSFSYIEDTVASVGVTMWDGFEWTPFGNVINGDVAYSSHEGLEIYRGDLYACGLFDTLYNDKPLTYIARWDGNDWYNLGGSFTAWEGWAQALKVYNDTLMVGGSFKYVEDTIRAYCIAKWFMPDTSCNYMKPILYAYDDFGIAKDTFYLSGGEAIANFYNNNAYVDTWEWDFDDLGTANIKDPLHTFTELGEYNVQVTVTHGTCSRTANRTIYVLLGSSTNDFNSQQELEMQVYPNPSDNNFTVKLNLTEYKDVQVRINSINGGATTIIPVNGNLTEINTSSWRSGIYICNLFVDGKLLRVEKLVFE